MHLISLRMLPWLLTALTGLLLGCELPRLRILEPHFGGGETVLTVFVDPEVAEGSLHLWLDGRRVDEEFRRVEAGVEGRFELSSGRHQLVALARFPLALDPERPLPKFLRRLASRTVLDRLAFETPEGAPNLARSEPTHSAVGVPTSAWLDLAFVGPLGATTLESFALSCGGTSLPFARTVLAPERMVINPNPQLPPGSDCALRWQGMHRAEGLAFRTSAVSGSQQVVYDRNDLGMLQPVPDDFHTIERATLTGRELDVKVETLDFSRFLLNNAARMANRADGFSPLQPIVLELSSPPDPESLPKTIEDSLDPLATVGLFSISPGSPSYGARVPFRLHARSDGTTLYPQLQHALILNPAIPLEPAGRYAVVVSRRVLGSNGVAFGKSPFYQQALGSPQPGESSAVARVRELSRDVFTALQDAALPPLPPEDVALALPFTVRTVDVFKGDMLALKDRVLADPAPAFQITNVSPGGGAGLAAIVSGVWTAPTWLDGLKLRRDGARRPVRAGSVSISFTLALPEAALAGPVPITMVQHGNPDSSGGAVAREARHLAEAGFAAIGFDDAMRRKLGASPITQVTAMFQAAIFGGQTVDVFFETYGQQMAFLRLIEQLGNLDVLPVGAPDGVPDLDPAAPLTYLGISFGSVHAQAFLPYAPEIRAAAMVAGAGVFMERLLYQDTSEPPSVRPNLIRNFELALPTTRPLDLWSAIALAQVAYDPQEGAHHARFLYRDPVEVAGTTRKPSILLIEGHGDRLISANSTSALAWLLGPLPQAGTPLPRSFLGPVTNEDLVANVDAGTTAGLVQWVPSGVDGVPPSIGCKSVSEGHFCAQLSSESVRQRQIFFRSAVDDPAPRIVNPARDADGDGLGDLAEELLGSDPLHPDSDRDGLLDGDEAAAGLDPLDATDADADFDGDGLTNREEVALGANPRSADSDGDGLLDGDEATQATDPANPDTDGGGRSDGREVLFDGTDPLDPADDVNAIDLPATLVDGSGTAWTVRSDSSITTAGVSRGWSQPPPPFAEALLEDDGRELVVGVAVPPGGLRRTRKIFVPADRGFVRFLEIFENDLPRPVTQSGFLLGSELSSPSPITLTSSGRPTPLDGDDWWVDELPLLGVTVADVFSGPGALVEPRSLRRRFSPGFSNFTFSVPVPSRGRAILLHFAASRGTQAEAVSIAEALHALGEGALEGVSREERDDIVNFLTFEDADGDFLSPEREAELGTDPLDSDSDGDGVGDGDEFRRGLDALSPDSDADGITDRVELDTGLDPLDPDTDDDGLPDGEELAIGTNPRWWDSDYDGVNDGDELAAGLDPLDRDVDDDGLLDGSELGLGTDPRDPDTDDDGLPDGYEVDNDFDPLAAGDERTDPDGDGLDNLSERSAGTGPRSPDTDGDGLLDGEELTTLGTDPLRADTDNDGLRDQDELMSSGTDPLRPDTDGGGRTDGEELLDDQTNPLDPADDFMPLPFALVDASGAEWLIGIYGTFSGGQTHAIVESEFLFLTDPTNPPNFISSPIPAFAGSLSSDGRTLRIGPNGFEESGLRMTRDVFVPDDAAFARFYTVLENPSDVDITTGVAILTGFNLPFARILTASGDALLGSGDNWLAVAPGEGQEGPAYGLVRASSERAELVDYYPDLYGEDFVFLQPFEIPAGGRIAILSFAVQRDTLEAAAAAAAELAARPEHALQGLTPEQRALIAN